MSGGVDVIVATSAFGMGIDKPDIRFVVHYDVTDSLDSYYQEVGRAGRDGSAARAILFFSERDLNLQRFFAGGGRLSTTEVERVLAALRSADRPLKPSELKTESQLSQAKVERVLSRLEDQGLIRRELDQVVLRASTARDFQGPVDTAVEAQTSLVERRRARISAMQAYARSRGCRRAALLAHFGEALQGGCTGCDNCDHPLEAAPPQPSPAPDQA
jgi:ATP-dependent DNA helicase RecQ